jgi:hypothetical protein
VAADLFRMPVMQFEHALGLTVFLGVIFFICNATARLLLGGPDHLMKGERV